MPSRINIAILGAGIFVKEAYIPALAALGDAAPILKAVYSRSERSARDAADIAVDVLRLASSPKVYHDDDKSSDLDVLLASPDIDAVIVVLPITLQPSIILKALHAGKHVLSEKPVAADVQAGISLIKTYKERYRQKGLVWRVAENFEAEPGFRAAAEAIRAGKIGRVVQFRAVVENFIDQESKWYKTAWRTIPDYQGGFTLDGGVHFIAVLRLLLPEPITHLTGFASLNKGYLAPCDSLHAVVRAGKQIHGIVDMTWAWPTKSRASSDTFVISGTDGWISIGVDNAIVKVKTVSRSTNLEEIIEKPLIGVQTELTSFCDRIAGTDTMDIGEPVGALRDVAFIQAALGSNGALVNVFHLVPEGL